MTNPLIEIQKLGQSIWYDNIRRALLVKGDLKEMIGFDMRGITSTFQSKIGSDDLRGITSNPTIFEKAITGSTDYDESMKRLIKEGKDVKQIYEALVMDDIAQAADLLFPVYVRTSGVDGYVSLEVSPKLARDTQGTIEEAKRLFSQLNRKNVMIKVPATEEGIPAIEELIYSGVNVNVTLIFSIAVYEQVAEAYIRGLERRASEGLSVDDIASVASFFVSRVDTAVDAKLREMARAATDEDKRQRYLRLCGKAAIANAKLAYQKFKEIFYGERFRALRERGAMLQRPLWASTSTKDPAYSDVYYVEELIGPDTVNTLPPATYTAVRDHAKVRPSLEENVEGAKAVIAELAEVGIDLDAVTERLKIDGVNAFMSSFDSLFASIEAKRAAVLSEGPCAERVSERLRFVEKHNLVAKRKKDASSLKSELEDPIKSVLAWLVPAYDVEDVYNLDELAERVSERLRFAEKHNWVAKIWKKDASLWKSEPEHQAIIKNALGWLTVPEVLYEQVDELKAFAEEICKAGFEHVLLLGMGGSSLCVEVFRQTFGKQDGYPTIHVLDSTDPVAITWCENTIELEKTLFIVSSKSGSTTETNAFFKYFYDKVKAVKGEQAGAQFVAITDPGTSMEKLASEYGFRRIFLNPTDIGGRYSALSYFGMVPAALQGIDFKELLARADRVIHACDSCVPIADNPGARLGAILGELAIAGRDKLTLVMSPELSSFGLWIEQLVAESTGKEGKGILPVVGELLGPPSVYGNDRLFVQIALAQSVDADTDAKLNALESAGHPVVRYLLTSKLDLGEQFFIWEFATAFAGAILEINPFDQPNVQESKDNTNQLLAVYAEQGSLPADGNALVCSSKDGRLWSHSEDLASLSTLAEALKAHFAKVKPGDYCALLVYMDECPDYNRLLQTIRMHLRDGLKVATTVGYGPRFLHSTGQLHKGGPASGVFLQIVAQDVVGLSLDVPGEKYTFGILKAAQALGDFRSLKARERRAVSINLKPERKLADDFETVSHKDLHIHLRADRNLALEKLLGIIRQIVPLEKSVN
ncbi:MAG: bifunctional transaldolase/phosoglucose isomerase [Acidobacteriota bacterium]|nr:bifunctional transaldolase/phosoglucose isomerase [Blastocatellia bacterium]MDW8411543.1 bifunctional transaldolase/phosoglucose isomerase [Acidobacteriota bacterium]